jgi:hypothetical protein
VRTKYTFRKVIIDEHRNEIKDIAKKMAVAKGGDERGFLRYYDKAIQEFKATLSEETLTRYLADAKIRNKSKLSESEQCRYVRSNFSKDKSTESH